MKITIEEIRKIVEEELLDEKKKKSKSKKKASAKRKSKKKARRTKRKAKRDACYHKVKSRYDVWPSAYASGALVKCRKVGAKNWGNSKKEGVDRDRIKQLVETELSKLDEKKGEGLRKWFGRKGAPGKKKGWVDCNTCRKDKKTGRKKCSACGRESGESRSKYPKCRPTPSACSKKGNYGKKSKAGKKG